MEVPDLIFWMMLGVIYPPRTIRIGTKEIRSGTSENMKGKTAWDIAHEEWEWWEAERRRMAQLGLRPESFEEDNGIGSWRIADYLEKHGAKRRTSTNPVQQLPANHVSKQPLAEPEPPVKLTPTKTDTGLIGSIQKKCCCKTASDAAPVPRGQSGCMLS